MGLKATAANETDTEVDGVVIEDEGEVIEDRQSFEYTLGSDTLGRHSNVIDKALKSMKKGGVVSLFSTGEYAYGDKTPHGAKLELSLLEVYKTDDISWSWLRKGTVVKKRMREAESYEAPQEADVVKL